MKKGPVFHWGAGHLQVDLYPPTDRRTRFVTGLEITVLVGFWAGLAARRQLLQPTLFLILLAVLTGVSAVVLVRMAHRVTFRESLFIDPSHITLIHATCFSKSVRTFARATMGPLRYLLAENTEPLQHCRPSDLFCEAYSPQLRKALTASGNLAFDYNGERIYFGRGVYSWHAEELAFYLQLYCGSSLQFGPEWQTILAEAHHD